MPDVLKRLVGPQGLTSSSVTLYTAPAETTTVLRHLHVASYNTNIVNFFMALNAASSTGSSCLFNTYGIPGYGALDWSGILVLGPGDYLTAHASLLSALTITVSGVETTA